MNTWTYTTMEWWYKWWVRY